MLDRAKAEAAKAEAAEKANADAAKAKAEDARERERAEMQDTREGAAARERREVDLAARREAEGEQPAGMAQEVKLDPDPVVDSVLQLVKDWNPDDAVKDIKEGIKTSRKRRVSELAPEPAPEPAPEGDDALAQQLAEEVGPDEDLRVKRRRGAGVVNEQLPARNLSALDELRNVVNVGGMPIAELRSKFAALVSNATFIEIAQWARYIYSVPATMVNARRSNAAMTREIDRQQRQRQRLPEEKAVESPAPAPVAAAGNMFIRGIQAALRAATPAAMLRAYAERMINNMQGMVARNDWQGIRRAAAPGPALTGDDAAHPDEITRIVTKKDPQPFGEPSGEEKSAAAAAAAAADAAREHVSMKPRKQSQPRKPSDQSEQRRRKRQKTDKSADKSVDDDDDDAEDDDAEDDE